MEGVLSRQKGQQEQRPWGGKEASVLSETRLCSECLGQRGSEESRLRGVKWEPHQGAPDGQRNSTPPKAKEVQSFRFYLQAPSGLRRD